MISLLAIATGLVLALSPVEDRDRDAISDFDSYLSGDGTATGDLPASGSFLYDRSHGGFITMTDFGNYLISHGWTFEERTAGALTTEVLDGVDILFLPNGLYIPFTAEELRVVGAFLDGGGGLWMVNDYMGYEDILNQLSVPLGVTFHDDDVWGGSLWPGVTGILPHPVTDGVFEYTFYAGSCLEANPPGLLLARLSSGHSLYCPATPGVLAIWEGSAGRAVFQSDATPLHATYFPERLSPQHLQLLDNILLWLLGTEPVSLQKSSWGSIKTKYQPEDSERE